MTLQCNLAEAAEMIRKSCSGVTDVVIETTPTTPGMNYVEAIYRVTRLEFPNTYASSHKIPAIKRMRELVGGLGLAGAKAAVEQPDRAMMYFVTNGCPMTNY